MSLLRNVLKKNTAKSDAVPAAELSNDSKDRLLSLKNSLRSSVNLSGDARSVKSSGGVTVFSVRSIAESVTSFTSAIFGGKRIPKRRRPDVSRLGVPKWYDKNSPPAPEMPGTEKIPELGCRPFVVGHAHSQKGANGDPYMSMVLFSQTPSTAKYARYYDGSRVTGELRLRLRKPESILTIDLWCIGRSDSILAVMDGNFVQQYVNLYDRNHLSEIGPLMEDKTFIFPFQFEPLPADIKLTRPDSLVSARIPLPPSHSIHGVFSGETKYFIGVNIRREGSMTMDELWDTPFQYYPARRPITKEPTIFPFIPDREDWPYGREEIGGWTVTPFGGRGRYKHEIVEIEGLLGVQAPEVYTAGQKLRYSLLLWSKSIPALEALTNPTEADIDVVFAACDMFGKDVLHPRSSTARKNRFTKRLAQGRVWRTDDGPPEDDEMPALREGPEAKKITSGNTAVTKVLGNTENITPRRSRMEEVMIAPDEVNGADEEDPRSSSPMNDEEAEIQHPLDPDEEHLEGTVRLDGDVLIPQGLVPSFRHKWMGREYMLHITFAHTHYSHISPSAISIYAETPIWIVLAKPDQSDQAEVQEMVSQSSSLDYLATLPIVGDTIPITGNTVRAAVARGVCTTKARPLPGEPRYGM